VGTQYRSGVYTTSAEQQAAAEAAIERLNDKLGVRAPRVRLAAPVSAADGCWQGCLQPEPAALP